MGQKRERGREMRPSVSLSENLSLGVFLWSDDLKFPILLFKKSIKQTKRGQSFASEEQFVDSYSSVFVAYFNKCYKKKIF